MNQQMIPAEEWRRIAETAYSTDKAIEHTGSGPVPVRSAQYGGHLYVVFSILHGPYGINSQPWIEAWRLLPEAMYTGETTLVYNDKHAIQAGLRKRGDHTGLVVSVQGRRMVCAERVRFTLGLPGTRPLSFEEAKAADERRRTSGWISLRFSGIEPEWFSLQGHPVALYRGADGDFATLLWKHRRMTYEMPIAGDVPLSPIWHLGDTPKRRVDEEQLALF